MAYKLFLTELRLCISIPSSFLKTKKFLLNRYSSQNNCITDKSMHFQCQPCVTCKYSEKFRAPLLSSSNTLNRLSAINFSCKRIFSAECKFVTSIESRKAALVMMPSGFLVLKSLYAATTSSSVMSHLAISTATVSLEKQLLAVTLIKAILEP